jgi:hypothetical protein
MSSEADPADDEFMLISVLDLPNNQSMLCVGTGGTLTVQSTSGGRVKGTYNATAGCIDPTDFHEVDVTLTGNFDATQSTDLDLPNASRTSETRAQVLRVRTAGR